MKKLNIISPGEPAPFGKGYQVLIHYRLEALANEFDINLYTFNSFRFSLKTEFEKMIYGNITHYKISLGIFEIIQNFVIASYKKYPFLTIFNTSRSLQKILKKEKSPKVLCYLSRCFLNCTHLKKGSKIIEFVDSMSLNFERRINGANFIQKIIFKREKITNQIFEQQISEKVNMATVVSSIDAKLISPIVETHQLGIKGIETSFSNPKDNIICFSGNMNYSPNIEAVLWFYSTVWKNRPDEFKNWKFRIIGAQPVEKIKNLSKFESSIEVTGFVDSILDEISKCKIAIAPMQSGSGMQFKVLESMAIGVPVVATPLAIGDIRITDKENILIAENCKDFWNAFRLLINDSSLYYSLSKNAQMFISQNHNWKNLNQKFIEKATEALN